MSKSVSSELMVKCEQWCFDLVCHLPARSLVNRRTRSSTAEESVDLIHLLERITTELRENSHSKDATVEFQDSQEIESLHKVFDQIMELIPLHSTQPPALSKLLTVAVLLAFKVQTLVQSQLHITSAGSPSILLKRTVDVIWTKTLPILCDLITKLNFVVSQYKVSISCLELAIQQQVTQICLELPSTLCLLVSTLQAVGTIAAMPSMEIFQLPSNHSVLNKIFDVFTYLPINIAVSILNFIYGILLEAIDKSNFGLNHHRYQNIEVIDISGDDQDTVLPMARSSSSLPHFILALLTPTRMFTLYNCLEQSLTPVLTNAMSGEIVAALASTICQVFLVCSHTNTHCKLRSVMMENNLAPSQVGHLFVLMAKTIIALRSHLPHQQAYMQSMLESICPLLSHLLTMSIASIPRSKLSLINQLLSANDGTNAYTPLWQSFGQVSVAILIQFVANDCIVHALCQVLCELFQDRKTHKILLSVTNSFDALLHVLFVFLMKSQQQQQQVEPTHGSSAIAATAATAIEQIILQVLYLLTILYVISKHRNGHQLEDLNNNINVAGDEELVFPAAGQNTKLYFDSSFLATQSTCSAATSSSSAGSHHNPLSSPASEAIHMKIETSTMDRYQLMIHTLSRYQHHAEISGVVMQFFSQWIRYGDHDIVGSTQLNESEIVKLKLISSYIVPPGSPTGISDLSAITVRSDMDTLYAAVKLHKDITLRSYLHILTRMLAPHPQIQSLAIAHIQTHAMDFFPFLLSDRDQVQSVGVSVALGGFIAVCCQCSELWPILVTYPLICNILMHALKQHRFHDNAVHILCKAIALLGVNEDLCHVIVACPECCPLLCELLQRNVTIPKVFGMICMALQYLLTHSIALRRELLDYSQMLVQSEAKCNMWVTCLTRYQQHEPIFMETLCFVLSKLLCLEDTDVGHETRMMDMQTVETRLPGLMTQLQSLLLTPPQQYAAWSGHLNIMHSVIQIIHRLLQRFAVKQPRVMLLHFSDGIVEALKKLEVHWSRHVIDPNSVQVNAEETKRQEIISNIHGSLAILPLYHKPSFCEKLENDLVMNPPPEDDLGNFIVCPITLKIMQDPVMLSDGHSYEYEAIREWLREHSRSPTTNERLETREMFPNRVLKLQIEGYIKKRHAEYLNQEYAGKPAPINQAMNENEVQSLKKRKVEVLSSPAIIDLTL